MAIASMGPCSVEHGNSATDTAAPLAKVLQWGHAP